MNKRKQLVSILAGVMAAVLLLSMIAGLLPTQADAASSSEIRKQINSMKEQQKENQGQIKDIKAQYQENEDEIADIINKKSIIDQEIGLLRMEILLITEQISAYNVLIADKQDELDNAQKRYEELNAMNKERIRAMEEDGSVSYWEVLFQANSFSDLLDRLNMVEEIAASDQRRLRELSDAADAVEEAQEELTEEKIALEETKTELDGKQVELDEKRQEADDLVQELLEKAAELELLQEELEAEDNALLDEIARKEKEYTEAKYQEYLAYMATYTTVPPTTQETTGSTNNSTGTNNGGNSGNTGSNGGTTTNKPANTSWIRPCSYVYLSSPFGNRNTGIAGASTYHQGVDLAAPQNTPIYASRSGTVTVASYGSSAGYYVTINHGDGFSSIYMHMETFTVRAGQQVSQGQLIGYVGKTGVASGYHLHFGIAYNGAYVNPCAYVNLS